MSAADTDTTRERLLEAAGEIFAEKGFEAATVRDICNAGGANVAAVNYYFGDKQRLYVEAVVRAHRWRMEQFEFPKWSADTPATQKLRDFITTFLRRVLTGPGDTWHTRLIMREIAHPSEACAELVQSSIRPQFEVLIGILRELVPPGSSDEKIHRLAFSIVGQCLFYHFADPVVQNLLDPVEYESLDVQKLADHVTEFSLRGLGTPTSLSQAPS